MAFGGNLDPMSDTVIANGLLLAKAAHVLGIPVIGTEQNPAGLGPNVEQIRNAISLPSLRAEQPLVPLAPLICRP